MYKINNFLFNIKKETLNIKTEKEFNKFFPNFDSIIYFFSIAKEDDINSLDLNFIIRYGMEIYNPDINQLKYLFYYIAVLDNIDEKLLSTVFSSIKKDLNIKMFADTTCPSISKQSSKLIFKKEITKKYNEYNSIFSYSYKSDIYNNTLELVKYFKNKNLSIDYTYFNFIKNKTDLYLQFKNFDNYFGFFTDIQTLEAVNPNLSYNSHKTTAVSIASQSLYSLYYAIDLIDQKTKIFIGETQDFDDCNEMVANNFSELLNSEESLFKIYNFMKADTLATEY